ncbi:aldo/keto reductase [Listeria booriae]|uniref:Aldo/keto reductase n=1 Tax=Listeria booriae TaxID=1552123 RepID=A0A842CUY2_9LIST|nr:aldo/keto reductase [Listeria booriae]MBC2002532.1 aldo/keto reductase [Listeria booriae]
MKNIIVHGRKNKQPIEIACSQLVMGSGDFLRVDNMEDAGAVLDRYFELGGNTFDTARHYRHSEKAIGEWMESRKNRDDVVIQTKGCHPIREMPNVPRVSPDAIADDISLSLEMLRTDHVELFALHRDDPTVPVGAIMEALHREVESGRVYAIGASNWELDRIMEANDYAIQHNLTTFDFNSPNLSLAKVNRPRWENCVSADARMIAWHELSSLPLFSWSSQAGGFFSGRFQPDNVVDEEMVEVYYSDANWERYHRAQILAKEKHVTPIQISLSYVLNQKFPTAAVIGPENVEELMSSVAATQIVLTEDEVEWLDLKRGERVQR